MRLVIGKANIEHYENEECGAANGSMDVGSVTFMWKDTDGVAKPAFIVYEASDFTGGGTEPPTSIDGGLPDSSPTQTIDGGSP